MFSTLAALALNLGPSVVRGIGGLFGNSTTVSHVADVVENIASISGLSTTDKTALVEAELVKLPREQLQELVRLKTALEAEQTKREAHLLADKQQQHFTTQETIRAGDMAEDPYVRNTRPLIARQSWYVTALYVLTMSLLSAFEKGSGPSIEVCMLLISGAWVYMGLRTADGFAPNPKSSGQKASALMGRLLGRK